MQPYSIPSRWLLRVYLVVPLSAFIVAIDWFWWKGALRSLLPNDWSASHFVWIAFYINYPHLVANAYSFFDGEYFGFYRNQLLLTLGATALLVFVLQARINPVATSVIFWLVTAYHVVMQQIGVTKILGFHSGVTFTIWKWLIVSAQMLAHLLLVLRLDLVNHYWPSVDIQNAGGKALILLCLCAAAVSIMGHRRIRSVKGRGAMWLNSGMVVLMAVFYFAGYGFFSILMVTTVHNITAFIFYVVHDLNRNAASSRNISYLALRFTGLPIWAQSLGLSLVLGYLGIRYASLNAGVLAVSFISYFHYISDGYVWKRGSLHRQFAPVA